MLGGAFTRCKGTQWITNALGSTEANHEIFFGCPTNREAPASLSEPVPKFPIKSIA